MVDRLKYDALLLATLIFYAYFVAPLDCERLIHFGSAWLIMDVIYILIDNKSTDKEGENE